MGDAKSLSQKFRYNLAANTAGSLSGKTTGAGQHLSDRSGANTPLTAV